MSASNQSFPICRSQCRPIRGRGQGLQRQKGTRNIQTCLMGTQGRQKLGSSSNYRNLRSQKPKSLYPKLTKMQAIVEEDDEVELIQTLGGGARVSMEANQGRMNLRQRRNREASRSKSHLPGHKFLQDQTAPFDNQLFDKTMSAIHEGEPCTNKSGEQNEPPKMEFKNKTAQKEDTRPTERIHPKVSDCDGIKVATHGTNPQEQETSPVFVLSPRQLPDGLRRRESDTTESSGSDEFQKMLRKKPENLLALSGSRDEESVWTEFVIADQEGRERYHKEEIQRRRSSYRSMACSNNGKSGVEFALCNTSGTLPDEKTLCDQKRLPSRWEPSLATPASTRKNEVDNQSYLDFTVLDNTVAVSYLEDDGKEFAAGHKNNDQEDVAAPKSPSSQDDEKSLFHVFAKIGSTYDDDMTQITMDHALLKHPPLAGVEYSTGGFAYPMALPACEVPEPSLATTCHKKRIQEILWNDLHSLDRSILRFAMEDLRELVASDPSARKQILWMGGILVLLGTMEKYPEEETIQYNSCVLIELLASLEPDAQKVINEMNGIQLVAQSMQHQAGSDRVQEAGRATLATLCK